MKVVVAKKMYRLDHLPQSHLATLCQLAERTFEGDQPSNHKRSVLQLSGRALAAQLGQPMG
jgi:hypothetical protein